MKKAPFFNRTAILTTLAGLSIIVVLARCSPLAASLPKSRLSRGNPEQNTGSQLGLPAFPGTHSGGPSIRAVQAQTVVVPDETEVAASPFLGAVSSPGSTARQNSAEKEIELTADQLADYVVDGSVQLELPLEAEVETAEVIVRVWLNEQEIRDHGLDLYRTEVRHLEEAGGRWTLSSGRDVLPTLQEKVLDSLTGITVKLKGTQLSTPETESETEENSSED